MDDRATTHGPPLTDFVDGLQAAGRYSFTESDLRGATVRSEPATDRALGRLGEVGRIVTPRRGFNVIVPTEYRISGSPPPSWFIDDLMHFLRQPYYVGLLSAASLDGASHQQPMTFQVVTDRPAREGLAGRARIEFHMSSAVMETPAVEARTETGSMRVSRRNRQHSISFASRPRVAA
jgi:hypothetical protein